MRVLIVSDAWLPQVNGVVTSLEALVRELRGLGHQVKLLSPLDFRSRPCPTYPEIPWSGTCGESARRSASSARTASTWPPRARSAGPRGVGW